MRAVTLATLIALPLVAACTDDARDADDKRPTRIVCTDQTGKRVHDDFASADLDVSPQGAYIVYLSATQEGSMRVSGQCVTYPMKRPADWTPIIQGLAPAS